MTASKWLTRIAAPFLVLAAMVAAMWLTDYATLLLPHGVRLESWLLDHTIFGYIYGQVEFGLYGLSAGVAVALLTSVLMRHSGRDLRPLVAHLLCAWPLYVIILVAGISYFRCLEDCEGLVLGLYRGWAYAAAGAAIGNGLQVGRAARRWHAA